MEKENNMNNSPKSEDPIITPVGQEEWEATQDYIDFLESYILAQNVINHVFEMRRDGKSFIEIMKFANAL